MTQFVVVDLVFFLTKGYGHIAPKTDGEFEINLF